MSSIVGLKVLSHVITLAFEMDISEIERSIIEFVGSIGVYV